MSTRTPPPPAGSNEWHVREENRTLVDFLAEALGISKAKAKDRLDARGVFVNGRRVWMAKHPLQRGDVVRATGAAPAAGRPAAPAKLVRLLEDASLVVVDKPAGMPSNDKAGSVEEALNREGKGVWLPVHRLDAETTGCLLFAANAEIKAALVAQFKAQTVRKAYEGVAVGRMEKDKFTIRAPLDGLAAVSHVRVVEQGAQAALLRVEIETGRTHQIRRHLAGIGHPLAGDKQYAGKMQLNALLQQCPRHLLHARELSFLHPVTGKSVTVVSPRPRDLAHWCARLGLSLKPQ